jgi:nucleotide-binding universal stress UspA family protein
MIRNFRGADESVVAAVAFDEHSDAVIESAVELCRRTKMRLRLVHVCQPEEGNSYLMPYFAHAERRRLEEYLGRSAESLAQQRLEDLAARIPSQIERELRVMTGDPAEWINADAVSSGSSIVVIGVGKSRNRFVPQSWSTALSLMSQARLSVLVVDQAAPLKFDAQKRPVILLADDLSDHSRKMIGVAFDIAMAFKQTDVHHVHASALTEDAISAAVEASISNSDRPVENTLSGSAMHAMIMAQMRSTMETRAGTVKSLFEVADCRYFSEVLVGDVRDSLKSCAEKLQPDLLIFGRHQQLHRRPFLIGRVPFHAMVSQNRPVMIIPEQKG